MQLVFECAFVVNLAIMTGAVICVHLDGWCKRLNRTHFLYWLIQQTSWMIDCISWEVIITIHNTAGGVAKYLSGVVFWANLDESLLYVMGGYCTLFSHTTNSSMNNVTWLATHQINYDSWTRAYHWWLSECYQLVSAHVCKFIQRRRHQAFYRRKQTKRRAKLRDVSLWRCSANSSVFVKLG